MEKIEGAKKSICILRAVIYVAVRHNQKCLDPGGDHFEHLLKLPGVKRDYIITILIQFFPLKMYIHFLAPSVDHLSTG